MYIFSIYLFPMSVLLISNILMSYLLDIVFTVLGGIFFICYIYNVACLLHSPASGVSTETHTTLERISPIDTPRVEGSLEQIQAKTSADDVEAIKDILSEITDIR